jgi:hypothetical protein
MDEDEAWAVYSALHASVHLPTTYPDLMILVLTLQEEALDLMEDIVTRPPSRPARPASATT